MSKFLTYVLLFAASFVLTQTSAKAGDRSFDSQIKEVGHRKYQRSSTLGKVSFYFSDQAKCKLDDNLQKRTLGTINVVDTLFTSEQIYEAVEIDEWCDPSWSKNNVIILGQESGGPVLSDSVIAHEYAHSILGKKLGYQAQLLRENYLKTYYDLYCLGCKPNKIQIKELELLQNQVNYLFTLHEYFADVVALTAFDVLIYDPASANRDFSKVLNKQDLELWNKNLSTDFDSHYGLQPIWYETSLHILKTKGNTQAKIKFLNYMLKVVSNEFFDNIQSYSEKPLNLNDLNQRVLLKLRDLPENW